MDTRVMIGMSGGVDSSVSALLLKEKGYDVTGVTMILHHGDSDCGSNKDAEDARLVCEKIGIDHMVIDFTEEFNKYVVDYFAETYLQGKTPNPCVACNRHIKFSAMLKKALELDFDFVATGHYAKIVRLQNGRYAVKEAPSSKDQSYVLYSLSQFQLAHTLMPIGDYTKDEIREIAERADLVVANKPESQDICFIKDGDYAGFIESYTGKSLPKGHFVDKDGNVLGEHKGLTHYTIGQRKGLGIAFGEPMYVTSLNPKDNTVTLGKEGSQYRQSLVAEDVNFMAVEGLSEPVRATARVRYQSRPAPCVLSSMEDGRVLVSFDSPQRSVTPGQSVVFYDGDIVLGGGTISDEFV